MKKLTLFIIVWLNSCLISLACGYYPMGEEIRYSLFYPTYFKYCAFSSYNYNSESWGFDYTGTCITDKDENIEDWYQFFNGKVPIDEISTAIYGLALDEITEKSENKFLLYLYSTSQFNVIDYIKSAKSIEDINTFFYDDDPWEKNQNGIKLDRNKYLKLIAEKCNTENNIYLKRRYAFLIIRLSYYNGDYQKITDYFKSYFENSQKDFLYYWSTFFYSFAENNSSKIASVFANSLEKRNATYYYFHQNFNLQHSLKNAINSDDIANAYIFASIQKLDKNIKGLTEIYKHQPNSESLDFLLLREINKLEDWIYTPYYANYSPSTELDFWEEKTVVSTNILRARSEKDREYAKELLRFVENVNIKKVNDPILWKACKIQLLFMSKDYITCIKQINGFLKKYPKEQVCIELEQIKALCYLANQKYGEAVISDIIRPIIEKNLVNKRFMFAAGRELEFLGNLPDAVALISNIDSDKEYDYGLVWQGNRLKSSKNLEYFTNTFSYLDYVYSAKDLQKVVDKLDSIPGVPFEKILYAKVLKNKNYLKDLLGTKYIREDNLKLALATFNALSKDYWNNNYNTWERDRYNDGYTFDQNPFFDLKYTDNFIIQRDHFKVTKLSVTEYLTRYLNIANNPKAKDRDYYYFIVANCYYNMSQYGNSWMMRRYNSTTNYYNQESYIDEAEYRKNNLAQKYYLKAYEQAKTPEFKALCLRMSEYAITGTRNFVRLKTEFPQYFEELSNCYHLTKYFNAR